jgi:hypothetical protein
VSIGPKGVLEFAEVGNRGYFEKSKDVFFGISTNIRVFGILIVDSESSEIGDSEYIGISWISCVG